LSFSETLINDSDVQETIEHISQTSFVRGLNSQNDDDSLTQAIYKFYQQDLQYIIKAYLEARNTLVRQCCNSTQIGCSLICQFFSPEKTPETSGTVNYLRKKLANYNESVEVIPFPATQKYINYIDSLAKIENNHLVILVALFACLHVFFEIGEIVKGCGKNRNQVIAEMIDFIDNDINIWHYQDISELLDEVTENISENTRLELLNTFVSVLKCELGFYSELL